MNKTPNKKQLHHPGLAGHSACAALWGCVGGNPSRVGGSNPGKQAERNLRPDSISGPRCGQGENSGARDPGAEPEDAPSSTRHATKRAAAWVGCCPAADRVSPIGSNCSSGSIPNSQQFTACTCSTKKRHPVWGITLPVPRNFAISFPANGTDPPLVVVKTAPDSEHEIQGLTGATISSESVSQIVNRTIENLRRPILGLPATAQH